MPKRKCSRCKCWRVLNGRRTCLRCRRQRKQWMAERALDRICRAQCTQCGAAVEKGTLCAAHLASNRARSEKRRMVNRSTDCVPERIMLT